MSTFKTWNGSSWDVSGGSSGTTADQFPAPLLGDTVVAASSNRTYLTPTASGSTHTWGSWVEVDPSLSANASGVFIMMGNVTGINGQNSSSLLQIGTGASSSEVEWATIGIGFLPQGAVLTVPGFIAAGTRVAVRAQAATASKVIEIVPSFLSEKSLSVGSPTPYLANTATSRGLTITAPGSLNTKGAWTELVASTATDFTQLGVFPQAAGESTFTGGQALIDIGIGAASSETVLIGDMCVLASSTEIYFPATPFTYGVEIPAGSRISARYARSATNDLDLIIVGA